MRQRKLKEESMVRRRKALSLAIGLSLASAPAFAQNALPDLPGLPEIQAQSVTHLPKPHPFDDALAPRRTISAKVVGLLGIGASQPLFPSDNLPALPGLAPQNAEQVVRAKLPGTESMVVMAAAADTINRDSPGSATNRPSVQGGNAYETTHLPSLPKKKELPVYESLSDPITDSLIDIEIPLEASTGRASTSAPVPTVLVTEAALPELPLSSPEESKSRGPELFRPNPGRGLSLDKLQPHKGNSAKNQVVTSSRGDSASANSVATASAAGTGATSFSLKDDDNLSFSLSDMDKSVSANKPLSLNGGGATPRMPLTAIAREPQPMRVQIEGVPATTVPGPQQVSSATAKPQIASNPSAPEFQAPLTMAETPSQQGRARLASLALPMDRSPTATTSLASSEMKQGEAIRVGIQDATLLRTESTVAQVSVENPQICQILQTGEKSYSLIGLQAGSTRIALVSTLESGQRSVEIREVTVAGPRATASSNLEGLADGILASLQQLYPQYAIDIDVVDRSLLVQGGVASETEAKRIIAFVRKASLTPVIDKLTSQEQ